MILASRSFGRRVTTWREVGEAVKTHTARAADKMRRQNLAAGQPVMFIQTDRLRPQDRQHMRAAADAVAEYKAD